MQALQAQVAERVLDQQVTSRSSLRSGRRGLVYTPVPPSPGQIYLLVSLETVGQFSYNRGESTVPVPKVGLEPT